MAELPLTGACACGGVRFEIREPPTGAGWCHCTRCQRRSGAQASPNLSVARGAFRIVAGQELVREWTPPGGGFIKAFCSVCGGQLYSRADADAPVTGVRMGALDADPGVRPQHHAHVASAAPWQPLPDDGLPRFERGRGSR